MVSAGENTVCCWLVASNYRIAKVKKVGWKAVSWSVENIESGDPGEHEYQSCLAHSHAPLRVRQACLLKLWGSGWD